MRADGDLLTTEGSALRERGREATQLGRDAIEAARKLGEAQRLRREGETLRENTQQRRGAGRCACAACASERRAAAHVAPIQVTRQPARVAEHQGDSP
jgi:hypothetical protein